ncbi:MAG TPA: hypothetical protein VHB51_03980 [Candidatus Saccharimonadales bacterium]|nr:hypothetical protein [Candidatus Saccharimonadales bacterium]
MGDLATGPGEVVFRASGGEITPDALTAAEERLRGTYLSAYPHMHEEKFLECMRNWRARARIIDIIRGDYHGDLSVVTFELIRDAEAIQDIAGISADKTRRLAAAAEKSSAFCIKATAEIASSAKIAGTIVRHLGYLREPRTSNKISVEGVLWSRYAGEDEGSNNIQEVLRGLAGRELGTFAIRAGVGKRSKPRPNRQPPHNTPA